ncbi:MAG: peptide chain release factor N(5)-glutamine methyltransferase [Ignavibacteriales bacterium]|nr:peptide chain release factor N(5)-glutamine methyltransferase [Ignavibacteriales bacterium]
MLTVLESLKLSSEYLDKKGIESARLNADLLLAEILKCKRLDLYLKFDQPLKENEIDKYREWIGRRGKYEPLQYIIGKVEFYGLEFKVTRDVLIPRAETEILVEEIIKFCKDKTGLHILDIGTGSGNIPVALARNLEDVEITAVDVSAKALEVAKENAILNNAESRIKFIHSDVAHLPREAGLFDLVISNPPYISAEEYPTLQKEIKDYEPTIALTDSNDGLDFYRMITEKSKSFLKIGGKIFFEIGKDQFEDVEKILSGNDFCNIEIIKDYQQIERVISGELK